MSSLWLGGIQHLQELREFATGRGLPPRHDLEGCTVRFAYRVRESESREEVLAACSDLVSALREREAVGVFHEAMLSDEEELAGRIEEATQNLPSAVAGWQRMLRQLRDEAATFIGARGGDVSRFPVLSAALAAADQAESPNMVGQSAPRTGGGTVAR